MGMDVTNYVLQRMRDHGDSEPFTNEHQLLSDGRRRVYCEDTEDMARRSCGYQVHVHPQ